MLRTDSLPRFKKHFMAPNHNYFKNIKIHRNSLMYRGAMLNIKKYRLRASSCPNIYSNSMTTLAKEREDVSNNYIMLIWRFTKLHKLTYFRNGMKIFWT